MGCHPVLLILILYSRSTLACGAAREYFLAEARAHPASDGGLAPKRCKEWMCFLVNSLRRVHCSDADGPPQAEKKWTGNVF